jgi:eukaryotic-like serine/threonine-protein kinase
VESSRTLVQAGSASEAPTRRTPFRRAGKQNALPEEPLEQLVLERYRLLQRLGEGGFGVVWRARDELLGRDVAVKRIWLGPDGDAERATREAQASARLAHPAIVALYEACPDGDAFYLISELVEGETLARLIAEDCLADEQALRIGLALLDGLEHAHERGVIHRDIKPQNVLVPRPARREPGVAAKLTDFGGASLVGEDALTRTGDVLGTLAYMAPEQSEGREVGEQADLYSLALVLYEALSGVNPVRGATPAATARRIGTRLEPLARLRRDLPRVLTAGIDAALAPSPRARGTLEDLRLELQEALAASTVAPRRARAARPLPMVNPTHSNTAETEIAPAGARIVRHGDSDDRARHAPDPVPGLPRTLWIALAFLLIAWQAASGRPGVALLAAVALMPLAAMAPERGSRRLSPRWLVAALAPMLGIVGLAGAFPALAGQAVRWRQRLVLGALGYWWLVLAEPLLARRLWLGPAHGTPAQAIWEGSLQSTATHVIGPQLTLAVLGGALLWGAAALVLPLVVRGRSAAFDVAAAVAWSTAVVVAMARLQEALGATNAHGSPRGAALGAVLGGLVAVGARALRGPV